MVRVRRVALVGGVLALLGRAPAVAAEPVAAVAPPSYALSWVRAEGAEECPAGRVLATEVERRLGRAVFDAAAPRSFEVQVTRVAQTYRSDVYVHNAGGVIGHRSLQSDEPGCGALVNATALAIALVIDPEAAAHEPARSRGVAAFEPLVVAPPPPVAPPAAPPATPAAAPAVVESRPLTRPAPTALAVSVRAQLTAGLVAATSPGLELSFGARPSKRWGVALAGSYTLAQTATRGRGSLDLGLTRGSVLGTLDAARSERLRLVLAAGGSVGAFHVGVRRPAPITAPGDFWFLAAQLAASLQVLVVKGIFIELGGQGFVPLQRQSFAVQGQTEPVFRQPLFFGLGFLGIGITFP